MMFAAAFVPIVPVPYLDGFPSAPNRAFDVSSSIIIGVTADANGSPERSVAFASFNSFSPKFSSSSSSKSAPMSAPMKSNPTTSSPNIACVAMFIANAAISYATSPAAARAFCSFVAFLPSIAPTFSFRVLNVFSTSV